MIGLVYLTLTLVASGPKPGDAVEPFLVRIAAGDCANERADFASEWKDRAGVFLFVQATKWDRPMARFIKRLDDALAQGIVGAPDAQAVAVWLTDDLEASREYLPKAQQSVMFQKTFLSVFEGDRFGPPGWSIDGEEHLTAVVVRNGKVVARFGFKSVNEGDVEPVVLALKGS